MVMLDMIYRFFDYSSHDIIVAHFDHGTRPSSAEDAEFVRKKAAEYGYKFRLGRAALGDGVAEETARLARYEFLERVRAESRAEAIFTAHHLCDLAETVAINLARGTGWRGLAAFGRKGARRPFLERETAPAALREQIPFDKTAILRYAAEHDVCFHEDPSNSSDEYLRNRIRHEINNSLEFSGAERRKIYDLWQKQWAIRTEIEQILDKIVAELPRNWRREWFQELEKKMGEKVARELLRAGIEAAGMRATGPQIERLRQAILDYKPGKYFNLGEDRLVRINKEDFSLWGESGQLGAS